MDKKPLILVVEDEIDMSNYILKIIRETERYEVVAARNGIEAFKLLDTNKRFLGFADNRIKCIILDLKMPEMNGLQFLKKLRQEEPFFRLMPVIVLSAYEDREKWDEITSPTVGQAAAYLKKPFNEAQLVDTIDRIFHGELGRMIDETREMKYRKLWKTGEETEKKEEM